MKTLKKILFGTIILTLPFLFSLQQEEINFKKLGKGRIVEKDRSIKKNILLWEIHLQTEDKAGWITYIKDGSLHDLLIEKIERIEFPASEQGAVKMVFENTHLLCEFPGYHQVWLL